MATLGELKDEVLRIVEDHIDSLTGTAITTHIQRAQERIEDRCAWRIQHAEYTWQVSSASTLYAWPDDFIAVRKRPRFTQSSTSNRYSRLIEYDSFEDLGLLTEEGVPRYWRDSGGVAFSVWPIGDGNGPSNISAGAYDVTIPYFKRLSTLTSDSDSNFWSTEMDDVLAWRAAAFVFAELRDPMANWWSSIAAARFLERIRDYRRSQFRRRDTKLYSTESVSSRTQRDPLRQRRTWIAEIP